MHPRRSSTNLARQPPRRSHTRVSRIQKVRRRNVQGPVADGVRDIAVHLGLLRRKVGDLAAVLQVLGVAKQHDALDLVADRRRQLADRVAHDGRALAVAARHDGRVGTLLVGQGEEPLGFVDGRPGRARGEEVLCQTGCVGPADALDPDVVGVGGLEACSNVGAGRGALFWWLVYFLGVRCVLGEWERL